MRSTQVFGALHRKLGGSNTTHETHIETKNSLYRMYHVYHTESSLNPNFIRNIIAADLGLFPTMA